MNVPFASCRFSAVIITVALLTLAMFWPVGIWGAETSGGKQCDSAEAADAVAWLEKEATRIIRASKRTMREGGNVVEVRGSNGGWFSWDALDLTNSD